MTQSTPGPWKFGHSGDDFWIGPQWDGQHVARVIWGMGEVVENGRENARLIAAAPELLEALKEARDYVRQDLKNIGPCEHDVGHCVCGILSMLHRMEEAIARAEGRS